MDFFSLCLLFKVERNAVDVIGEAVRKRKENKSTFVNVTGYNTEGKLLTERYELKGKKPIVTNLYSLPPNKKRARK